MPPGINRNYMTPRLIGLFSKTEIVFQMTIMEPVNERKRSDSTSTEKTTRRFSIDAVKSGFNLKRKSSTNSNDVKMVRLPM